MKQFEYMHIKDNKKKEQLNTVLKKYGAQGWELVFYDKTSGEIIFKREV